MATQDGKKLTPCDLHAEIVALREKLDKKFAELLQAQTRARGIWENQIEELFDLVPDSIDQREASRIFFEKFADEYNAAFTEVGRLNCEWMALMRQCDELEKQEFAELERELVIAGRQL